MVMVEGGYGEVDIAVYTDLGHHSAVCLCTDG